MKLLEIYKSILQYAGFTTSPEGYISVAMLGKTKPATVKGKRLVLPTPEQLSSKTDPLWEERSAFHIFYEVMTHGESETLSYYRTQLMKKVNHVYALVMHTLLNISGDTASHSALTPQQVDFLTSVGAVSDNTLERFRKILKSFEETDMTKVVVSMFVRRGAKVKGVKYGRSAIIGFPIYEELIKGEKKVFGVTLSNADRDALIGLHRYLFSKIDEPEGYNFGSNDMVAPTAHALLRGSLGIVSELTDTLDLFKNFFPDDDPELKFNDEWVPIIDNLDSINKQIRLLPMLPGNEGRPCVEVEEPAAPVAPPVATQPPVQAPYQAPPPPGYTPYQAPQMAPYQAPPPPTAAGRTGEISFSQLAASNPSYAMQYNAAPQMAPWQQSGMHPATMQQPAYGGWQPQQPVYGQQPGMTWQPQQPVYGVPGRGI